MPENPKMANAGLVALRVQTGPCPNGCPFCYYNGPDGNGQGYYEDIGKPHIPATDDFQGKLIRVNDGHDANLDRGEVLRKTWAMINLGALGAYMNTSIPRFDFPCEKAGRFPVIYTANGRYPTYVEGDLSALMAVRVRFNSWDYGLTFTMVKHYVSRGVPIILTAMRYPATHAYAIPPSERELHYAYKEHILNPYYCMTEERQQEIRRLMDKQCGSAPVLLCGKGCASCGNCAFLYDLWQRREGAGE